MGQRARPPPFERPDRNEEVEDKAIGRGLSPAEGGGQGDHDRDRRERTASVLGDYLVLVAPPDTLLPATEKSAFRSSSVNTIPPPKKMSLPMANLGPPG